MGKTVLKLGNNLVDCPQCWQNFVLHNQSNVYRDIGLRKLNLLLKPYKGRYVHAELHTDEDSVVFDDEQSLTWFIMRWS